MTTEDLQKQIDKQTELVEALQESWINDDIAEIEKMYLDAKHDLVIMHAKLAELVNETLFDFDKDQ